MGMEFFQSEIRNARPNFEMTIDFNCFSSFFFCSDPFILAIERGDLDAVESAIKNGENVNKEHQWGWSPLFHAASAGKQFFLICKQIQCLQMKYRFN